MTEDILSYYVCSEPFLHAVIYLDCTFSLLVELLNGVNLSALCIVAHKAACHAATLSKAFLKSLKTWYCTDLLMLEDSQRILRSKIYSVVLLPALNPACSIAIISLAWGFKLVQDEFQHNSAQMINEVDNNSCMGCLL